MTLSSFPLLRHFIVLLVIFFLGGESRGFAQTPSATPSTERQSYKPFQHMWYGTRDIPGKQNFGILAVGGAATLAAFIFADDAVKKFYAGNNRLGGAEWLGNEVLGTGMVGAALGAGTLVYGLVSGREHEIDAGEAHLEALLASFAYTSALKFSVKRYRPDSGNRQSFPSGHTSTMFTTAGSLMGMYGPMAGVPALALGAYTGLSRLASNNHHLSDVLFGATLGFIVGNAYTWHHRSGEVSEHAPEEPKITVSPYYDTKSNFGAILQAKF